MPGSLLGIFQKDNIFLYTILQEVPPPEMLATFLWFAQLLRLSPIQHL